MAHQSPMISIPKKATEDVDWTTPIRNLIAQSYGESPDNYSTECASLQRCRQDAVRGAGSDMTARDLLYKYFGQLELLELRFPEIRVNFPWRDAFTNKQTTQSSIAFEKASIIFQIAATHSAIAASQSRSDPEGLKRSFHFFKTCSGMLTYINENFLHAPSTDLSRDVVKFLVGVMLAQATEVFFEKCVDEKKANTLVSKIGAQAAHLYTTLTEEVKEFMGKGIFDRNWVTLLQIKAKYFISLSNYYRAIVDNTAGKYGESVARYQVAEANAKEARTAAGSFNSGFVTQMSPCLPPDAGSCIAELTKAHLALCTEKRTEAERDNDLIYNAIVPNADTLPAIDKTAVATPIPIQEVYGTPDVQKTIGPDLFTKLVPLSVHESASVYSEEKAKLVRGEVEKAETAEVELRSAIDALGVKDAIVRFKAMAEEGPGAETELPAEVSRWKDDITLVEEREPVTDLLSQLTTVKATVQGDLESVGRDLEIESRDCESMRVKYELWTQAPSASLTKNIRQDLKAHFSALEAAAASDQQVTVLWDSVRSDINLLISDEIENVFRDSTNNGPGGSLLDLDASADTNDEERSRIASLVNEIEERLSKLSKIARERNEVLKDLKEKVQTDDVSHLLLLNRRNTAVEPALFAAELEKFKPYQQRLAATVTHQQAAIAETTALWRQLKDVAGRGPGAKKWEEREKRKKETVRRFSRARDGYMEVRDGAAKGLQFYSELKDLGANLRRSAKEFVTARAKERDSLAAQLETQKRLSVSASPPPLAEKPRAPAPPPPPRFSQSSIDSAFASMNLGGSAQNNTWSAPPPPSVSAYQQMGNPPPPPPPSSQPSRHPSSPSPPSDPYANMFGSSPQFGSAPPPPPQHQPQYASPPHLPSQQHYSSPAPPQSYSHFAPPSQQQPARPNPGLPPPPPPVNYQTQYGQQSPVQSPPPPPQQQQQYRSFPPPPGQGSYPSQQPPSNQGYFNYGR